MSTVDVEIRFIKSGNWVLFDGSDPIPPGGS